MQARNLRDLEKALRQTSYKLDSLGEELGPEDPVTFCTKTLGFTPTGYQREVLLDESQMVCLLWSRQSGKTTTVAAKMLWTALTRPGSNLAVVSPSMRQSKAVIGKMARLAARLPTGRVESIQKTRIDMANGSIIEAYPNNPHTIRGPSLNMVYCDEMNYIRDDKDLYDAILFTISATNGTFIASSTPGSSDSIFYQIWNNPAYKFSRHHVTWKDALEPNGPLKQNLLPTIRAQLESDPWRWMREMEAKFAENQESFFPLELLTNAVDEGLSYRDLAEQVTGKTLYAGLDFGKHRDYSVLAVVEHDRETKLASLVHLHRFPLETDYSGVIGYAKRLVDQWKEVVRITTDTTGVGDVVTAEMRNIGLKQTWGITFTAKTKTDILENLHRSLSSKRLKLAYDNDLIGEMNSERCEISKSGQLLFSHPSGTHDDRLWALGLACYGMKIGLSVTEYHPAIMFGKHVPYMPKLRWNPGQPSGLFFPEGYRNVTNTQ